MRLCLCGNLTNQLRIPVKPITLRDDAESGSRDDGDPCCAISSSDMLLHRRRDARHQVWVGEIAICSSEAPIRKAYRRTAEMSNTYSTKPASLNLAIDSSFLEWMGQKQRRIWQPGKPG